MFGEGLKLQRVKRILSASNILHSVFSSAALAEETERGEGRDEGLEGVHRQNESEIIEMMFVWLYMMLKLCKRKLYLLSWGSEEIC